MKIRSLLVMTAILVGVLYTSPANAGVRVYVAVPPPPAIVETVPAPPSPRHVWLTGYHRWDGRAYIWVPGHYEIARRHYKAWVPGHWSQHRRGWYWVEGHWR